MYSLRSRVFLLLIGAALIASGTVPACALQDTAASQNSGNVPPDSSFQPPPVNACQSAYDRFYEEERGVYAYWPLCESGSPMQVYDYVGQFDLTSANHRFGGGVVTSGLSGPVADQETAAGVSTASASLEGQGMALNSNEGTIAAWINASATSYPVTAVFLGAVKGQSTISVGVNEADTLCFNGNFINAGGTAAPVRKCGYQHDRWHRVVLVWKHGALTLFVDGVQAAAGNYSGLLDNKVFYYKLFPGCCNTGKQMTLAKVAVANQAWSPQEIASDLAPALPVIPAGGVHVGTRKLGIIHRNVLGVADRNQDISTPSVRATLISGFKQAGVAALRYGGGYGGIETDLENWRGGVTCSKSPGESKAAQNLVTGNAIDSYLSQIAKPLAVDLVYTVNYGTNPPQCNAGGDPQENGASLVHYANVTKSYGIKFWEIGNEVYSNNSETDFHPNPNSGDSYVASEPAFYSAMKGEDPSILIAVPIGIDIYSWETGFTLPVLAGAQYDAVVFHDYPMRDPITDGNTLYPDRVASTMRRTRGALSKLQTELLNFGKPSDAIWITEWNAEVGGNKWSRQTMGAAAPLFVASQLAEFMRAGVQLATWWTQGIPNGCSTFNYDEKGDSSYSWFKCGGTSLVYTGSSPGHGEISVGLQPGDLTPAGRAFQLLSHSGFITEGESMLQTESDVNGAPWLQSYAATHGSSFALLLINRDRDTPHVVPVSLDGQVSGSAEQWTYGKAQYDAVREGPWNAGPVRSALPAWNETLHVTLPPWSVNVVVLRR